MNKHLHWAGLIVAVSIPLFVLPARIAEGQLNDPVNLAGSEVVIFMMSLTCWYCINFIQQRQGSWLGLVLSVLVCCVLSNVFYFTFNPIFKDFPFRTAHNPLGIKMLMLSSRGVLMSIILVPSAYYLKRDQQVRFERQENERLALEKLKFQNVLLEQAVQERTTVLYKTLNSLEKTKQDLEHQLHIQSHLVASITHDISSPFSYLIIVAKKISELISEENYEVAGPYSTELHKSLETMFGFVKNLLEFTKLPVQQKLAEMEEVNLAALIGQKSKLFEGIIKNNRNKLLVDSDPSIVVSSNKDLLGIVLHNLIDNANKHSAMGEIRIRAYKEKGLAKIVCENSGGSVPPGIIRWINSGPDTQADDLNSHTANNKGIGLILVKEITSLLGISLSMESSHSATKVHLTFDM